MWWTRTAFCNLPTFFVESSQVGNRLFLPKTFGRSSPPAGGGRTKLMGISMYAVYAIYNQRCDKIYIGQTQNLEERLRMHNNHTFGGYTSRYVGKWRLLYKEEFSTRGESLTREKQLKSFRGREFIRKHIRA